MMLAVTNTEAATKKCNCPAQFRWCGDGIAPRRERQQGACSSTLCGRIGFKPASVPSDNGRSPLAASHCAAIAVRPSAPRTVPHLHRQRRPVEGRYVGDGGEGPRDEDIADQVNDAGLNDRLRENGINGPRGNPSGHRRRRLECPGPHGASDHRLAPLVHIHMFDPDSLRAADGSTPSFLFIGQFLFSRTRPRAGLGSAVDNRRKDYGVLSSQMGDEPSEFSRQRRNFGQRGSGWSGGRGAVPTGAVMLRGKTEALLTAQQRRSPQSIPTQENRSELLMVTDAKLSLQNRRHDAMGGRFGLLVRGLRSGDTNCAGPDKRHPNRKRRHDELADAAWHDRLHLSNHNRTLSPV
jgi:hypothetical protein